MRFYYITANMSQHRRRIPATICIVRCIVHFISVNEEGRGIGRKFFLFGTIISDLSPRRVRFVVLIIRRIDSQNANAFAQMRNEDTRDVTMTSERPHEAISCVIDKAQPLWLEKSPHYGVNTSFPNIKEREDRYQKWSIFPWRIHYENHNTSRSTSEKI